MEARALIRQNGEAGATGVTGLVPWWSFTKTVLAIALLHLWEMGKIDLDARVEGKSYTPAQLLRHEAGLPDYGALDRYHAAVGAGQAPWSIDELLSAVDAERLRYEPGSGWAYSNIGYHKVGHLIEKASGRSLADALAALVFVPAAVATPRLAATPADLAGVSMGDAAGYHPGWVYHGLVVGTAMDAARLLHRLLSGQLVGPKALARMLERRALPQCRSPIHPDPAYGLGLMLRATDPLSQPIGHSGSGPGSRIAAYSRQGTTCVVWAATTSGIDAETESFSGLRT